MAVNGEAVLVGFAEAMAAIEATWSLQEAGFRIVAFTRAGAKPALRRVRGVELHRITAPEDDVHAAAADLQSEERGISEAIARNLMEFSVLETPIIVVNVGEGGSGVGVGGGLLGQAEIDDEFRVEFFAEGEGEAEAGAEGEGRGEGEAAREGEGRSAEPRGLRSPEFRRALLEEGARPFLHVGRRRDLAPNNALGTATYGRAHRRDERSLHG